MSLDANVNYTTADEYSKSLYKKPQPFHELGVLTLNFDYVGNFYTFVQRNYNEYFIITLYP